MRGGLCKEDCFCGGRERGIGHGGWKAGLRDKVTSGWHRPITNKASSYKRCHNEFRGNNTRVNVHANHIIVIIKREMNHVCLCWRRDSFFFPVSFVVHLQLQLIFSEYYLASESCGGEAHLSEQQGGKVASHCSFFNAVIIQMTLKTENHLLERKAKGT